MMGELGQNEDGTVTFDEFLDLMARIEKNIEKKEEEKLSERAKSQRDLNTGMTYI